MKNINIIDQYLKDINKVDVITDKNFEKELAIKAKNGDEEARNILLTSNLKFVVSIAKQYQNQGLDLEDLISEGNIGLLNAIDKFDPDKGYHFISYAVWWIRQAISKAISDKSRTVRLPVNRSNELVLIQKAERHLRKELCDNPSNKEIADYTNLSEETVKLLKDMSRDVISLDTPVSFEDSTSTLSDFIPDNTLSVEDIAIKDSRDNDINEVLNLLSEKEKTIIEMRFGLNGYEAMSLSEVGEIYNLTKERIRQIEKRAIIRLKQNKKTDNLKSYYSVA